MIPSRRNGLVSATDVANLRRSTQESDADEDEESDLPKSGSWKPQVHFVWVRIVNSGHRGQLNLTVPEDQVGAKTVPAGEWGNRCAVTRI